ncbi:hypothetical protein Sphch_0480 [Sphingobium chlorophenolicum L-1]|uniref:Uncharacterized protein n=1 Tax=Sphingobium chlorophenolicum L-1 TaxID=690566 RepID=F6EX14_SPHCR|nr:hypothetical protein [Sphingobium chlorophenolicum]AEG48177.1 hypothetical protein Sphch_0480 [Sphingobium chlorophenolicum L-1]
MPVQKKGAAVAALLSVVSASLAAMPVHGQTASVPAAEPDPAAVEKLIASIDAAVAALPGTATAQDVEAAVTFAIDQQQQPMNVNLAALEFIAARKNKPRKVEAAIASVIASLRRGLAGTGGILSGGGASLAAGPNVGGGGTGASYTPQN